MNREKDIMKNEGARFSSAHLKIILAMLIFGTVGVLRINVAFPSGFTAMLRGFIGAAVILIAMLIMRKKPSLEAIRKNLFFLIFSGAFIGINWILLFEAYNYTSVALATTCYYMAPIFVVIVSPFALGERIGLVKAGCILLALAGVTLVSEPWGEGFFGGSSFIGIALAIGAAAFYAGVTVLNRKMKDIPAMDMTLVQLLVGALVVVPYTFIAEDVEPGMFDALSVILVLVLGAVHTGLAYIFYLGSVNKLPAATSSIFGYIDPIFAFILSVFVLDEELSALAVVGAVTILLATVVSEFFGDKQLKLSKKEK